MEPIINSQGAIIAMLTTVVALSLFVQRFKMFKYIGPALTAIITGIILSNTGVIPQMHESYIFFLTYAVPVSLSIMLLDVDFKKLVKIAKEPLLAMIIAVCSVSVIAIIAGFIFAPGLDEGWKIAGMFVGSYTGGSANLTAIATGLEASAETLAMANAADYVIGIPTLLLLFASPGIIKGAKNFKKIWPYSVPEDELYSGEQGESGIFANSQLAIIDIAIMLAFGFAITEISTVLSTFFPADIQSAARILLITTISLILAQIPAVKKLKIDTGVGIFCYMFFLTILGATISISAFFASALTVTLYCLFIIAGCLILHITLSRLFKIKYQYVLLSITASIADPSSAALVASQAGWTSLISVGIALGVIGNVLGNYVGISVAYAIRSFIGV